VKFVTCLAWALFLVVSAATHAAPERGAVVELLPSPLKLPQRIGPMTLQGEPHKYDDPALGVSYQYGGDGLSLTVYVYDAGDKEIADGADTMAVCREFELAKQGVTQAYQKTQLKHEQIARLLPPDDTLFIREALYEYERERHPTISFVWVTAAARYFVKLRLSMDPRLREEVIDARNAVLSIVGEAIKPHLAPVDAGAKPAGSSLGFNLGGGSDDFVQAGIMYLALLNTVVDQVPTLAPVCGGAVVPTLEAEAGVYRRMSGIDEELAKTGFGKTIARIDEAGFLEEFLWVERHREAWGTAPPPDLDLDAFESWRKKNLKRFKVPHFGNVTINHPRPLPVEPPER
jgi:hypothetical protein